jgi:uncharacterized RDD family membrane protein YckC
VSQPDVYAPPRSSVSGLTPAELAIDASGAFPLATIGQRIGASLLEMVVLIPLIGLLSYLGTLSRTADITCTVLIQCLVTVYYIAMVGLFGGTAGKLMLGLRVVSTERAPATWTASILRYSVYGVVGLLSAAGQLIAKLSITPENYASLSYMERALAIQAATPGWATAVGAVMGLWFIACFICMLVNKQRRTLYDLQAGTIVVHKRKPAL